MVAATAGHLITYFQAIVIGLLQGVTELFPISSLGHAVILPKLLGWDLSQDKPYFLAFLVATHLATAIVLFIFFLPEWMRILRGLGRSLRERHPKGGDLPHQAQEKTDESSDERVAIEPSQVIRLKPGEKGR